MARGDVEHGARLLGEAAELRTRHHRPAGPLDAPDLARVTAALRDNDHVNRVDGG